MTRSRTATIALALAASNSCLMGLQRRSIPMKQHYRASRTGHP